MLACLPALSYGMGMHIMIWRLPVDTSSLLYLPSYAIHYIFIMDGRGLALILFWSLFLPFIPTVVSGKQDSVVNIAAAYNAEINDGWARYVLWQQPDGNIVLRSRDIAPKEPEQIQQAAAPQKNSPLAALYRGRDDGTYDVGFCVLQVLFPSSTHALTLIDRSLYHTSTIVIISLTSRAATKMRNMSTGLLLRQASSPLLGSLQHK